MSTLIFAQAKSIRKKCLDWKKLNRETAERMNLPDEEIKAMAETAYNRELQSQVKEFIEVCKIAKLLHEEYVKELGVQTHNWYFITIRPDDRVCTFEEFYDFCRKFASRKCHIQFTLTFEQKGETEEDIGKGFHFHMVTNMTQTSQPEVLRDVKSTFNKLIQSKKLAENCIKIKTTRNPDEIIEKYLTDYESVDDHKMKTKEIDKLWRQRLNLETTYQEAPGPLSIKYVRQGEEPLGPTISKDPIIVEFT